MKGSQVGPELRHGTESPRFTKDRNPLWDYVQRFADSIYDGVINLLKSEKIEYLKINSFMDSYNDISGDFKGFLNEVKKSHGE